MIGLYTTVFPSAEYWFDDFVSSLNNQTLRPDVIYCGNDNADELVDRLRGIHDNVIVVSAAGSPSDIRKSLLSAVVEDGSCEIVVGFDIDDIQSENRIEATVDAHSASGCEFVYVDILDWVEGHALPQYKQGRWSNRFRSLEPCCISKFTQNGNCLGLGNISFSPAAISEAIMAASTSVKVYDWNLFSLVDENKKAVFLSNAHVLYRRHSDSLAVFQPNNKNELILTCEVIVEIGESNALSSLSGSKIYENARCLLSYERDVWGLYESLRKKIENPIWWELGI